MVIFMYNIFVMHTFILQAFHLHIFHLIFISEFAFMQILVVIHFQFVT